MSFKNFNLNSQLLQALQEKGYTSPTPVQQQAIPHILSGKDVLACAQTGTGKTAAFCIPVLQKLSLTQRQKNARALILTPTRELALQVNDHLKLYGKNMSLKSAVIFGGVSQVHQVRDIRQGIDIIVATPGRLLDLIDQKLINLSSLE